MDTKLSEVIINVVSVQKYSPTKKLNENKVCDVTEKEDENK